MFQEKYLKRVIEDQERYTKYLFRTVEELQAEKIARIDNLVVRCKNCSYGLFLKYDIEEDSSGVFVCRNRDGIAGEVEPDDYCSHGCARDKYSGPWIYNPAPD